MDGFTHAQLYIYGFINDIAAACFVTNNIFAKFNGIRYGSAQEIQRISMKLKIKKEQQGKRKRQAWVSILYVK